MNKQQAAIAAGALDKLILLKVDCNIPLIRTETGNDFAHLRWMLNEIRQGKMSTNKTMRWLGYVQGVMVASSSFSLNDMKNVSRQAVGK